MAINTFYLEFDSPIVLTNVQVSLFFKISPTTLKSTHPEYEDSIFEVSPVEDGFSVTRRKISKELFQDKIPPKEIALNPSSIALSPKRALLVTELPPNDETFKKLATLASNWHEISCGNAIKLFNESTPNSHGKAIFEDLSYISTRIARCMEHPEDTINKTWSKIYVCEDVAFREIQAVALIKLDFSLDILYLATHPQNVRSKLNSGEVKRVEGAGSRLVAFLAKTVKIGQEIYLESTKSALPFYKKLGFVEDWTSPAEEKGATPMLLNAQKTLALARRENNAP